MLQHYQESAALYQWVTRVRPRNTPGFFDTIQDIMRLSGGGADANDELAYVILREPALTTRLLRVANQISHDPVARPISSVSRAIERLGFNTVRRIAVSIALIDEYRRGPTREHLARELARCFHASSQARALARLGGDPEPEEIGIAALLHSLGSIMFWSSGDRATVELDRALRGGARDAHDVEQAVLGFDLRQLTRRLNEEWNLCQLLDETLIAGGEPNARCRRVLAGHEIAAGVERGWSDDTLHALIARLAAELGIEPAKLMQRVRESALEAKRAATIYDAAHLAALIPSPGH